MSHFDLREGVSFVLGGIWVSWWLVLPRSRILSEPLKQVTNGVVGRGTPCAPQMPKTGLKSGGDGAHGVTRPTFAKDSGTDRSVGYFLLLGRLIWFVGGMKGFSQRIFRLAAGGISCCAASLPVLAETNTLPASVEIPLMMRQGVLMVEAKVNGSKPLAFKLDTGFGVTTIHPDLIESLRLERTGHTTILGIAGEEQADTYGGAVFDFDGMTYSPRRLAVLPSEGRRRGRRRDGILGTGFFRRFVVELDVRNQRMRLYEPERFSYTGKGEVLPLEFKKTTPIIEAAIVPEGRGALPGKFEIDTGCDGGVCVAHEFVTANH